MNLFHLLRPVVVLLVAAGSVIYSGRASGEERAYHSRSTAVLNLETGDFVAAGNGTHLGAYTELGNVSISGEDPTALDVVGSATLIAANDDELCVAIVGKMNVLTGTITGTITFEGAPTGRFEDATGSASLAAQLNPDDGTIAVVVVGTIDY
jgi:hypothetical protein